MPLWAGRCAVERCSPGPWRRPRLWRMGPTASGAGERESLPVATTGTAVWSERSSCLPAAPTTLVLLHVRAQHGPSHTLASPPTPSLRSYLKAPYF